jgi:UDP-galactopyranose mutase
VWPYPIRTTRDDRYVTELFQALPARGFTAMFEKMLSHPNIQTRLGTDFRDARAQVSWRHLIYTGPIDDYFDHCFGPLPYRSLRFEPETFTDREFYQPAMQVNYPNEHDFTRIVEIKHATGQQIDATTIVREYPEDYFVVANLTIPFLRPIPVPCIPGMPSAARWSKMSRLWGGWRLIATTTWTRSSGWPSPNMTSWQG